MPESPNLALDRPEPIVTREAPVSHVSGAEVAQPYQQLANSLHKVGQGLEDMAVPLAEKAGYKAVTRDADGNIQVEQMPMFGRAGVAYQHAVKMAALAEGEGAAKRADIAMRSDYRDNPQGYQVAAQAFKEQTVKQYTDAAGPEVGRAMGQAIDNTTTLTYRGLIAEKERLDLQRSENSIKAAREDAHDDAMALARQGAPRGNGPDGKPTPYQLAIDKYHATGDALADNPRLAYTKEQQALDDAKFEGELGGQGMLYHVNEEYKKNGRQAAEDLAKDVLTNPDYKLKSAQREAYYHKAIAEIRTNEAIRTQDYQLAQQNFHEMKADQAQGIKIEHSRIDGAIKTFEAIGGVKGANGKSSVLAWAAHADLHDDAGKQPLAVQNAQNEMIAGASRHRMAYDFYREKAAALPGVSPQQASLASAGLVGGFRGETENLNTMQVHDAGIGFGIAGWNRDRLARFTEFARTNKMSLADLRTQLEFSWHELTTTERGTLTKLLGARSPEEAGAIATGYFRPTDMAGNMQTRARYARAAYDVFAAGGDIKPGSPLFGAGPGIQSWLIAKQQANLKTSARQTWDQAMTEWNHGKGPMPSNEILSNVIQAGQLSNNVDLLARVARDTQVMDWADKVGQLPLAMQSSMETELERRMLEPGGAHGADVPAAMSEPGAELVAKTLRENTAALREGLQKEPWQTIVRKNPDHFKTPAPLDFSNPQQAAAGLAMRAQIVQAGANQFGTPPLSAVGDSDVETIKAALATPDPAARAQVWGVLATLPDNVRGPTFQKIAGNDPNALAEASAGSMMSEDPAMAKSIIQGLDIMKRNDGNILDAFKVKKGGLEGFDVELPQMLPPTAFEADDRLRPSGNYATMARMIQARYAYLSVNDPKGTEFSANRLQQAVNDVTGGLVSQGGRKTIAPERGMLQQRFDDTMLGITAQHLAGVTSLKGMPISPEFLRSEGKLEAIGNGQYLVNFASEGKPIYAMRYANTERPDPFVLNLRNIQPVQFEVPRYNFPLP